MRIHFDVIRYFDYKEDHTAAHKLIREAFGIRKGARIAAVAVNFFSKLEKL
jgi:hypothetical protein